MDFTVTPAGAAQGAPQHVADLRPVADAAALAGDARPAAQAMSALPTQPTLPAPVSQAAVIGRALLDDSTFGPAPVTEVTRVLKPWGVTMLPHDPDRKPGDAAPDAHSNRPDAGGIDKGD